VSSTAAILVTLILYKIVLVGLGLYAHRRTGDGADFFLGGRGLGGVVASLSASASSSSAWTLLGVSGAAYAWGLPAIWIFPGCVGGFVLNWVVVAPALKRASRASGAITVTQLLADASPGAARTLRVLASVIILVSLTTYVAAQFQAAGKTFAETFGLSMEGSILIGSGIVVVYTLLGGFWAVSLTDTLQGFMMALASVILPVAALVAVGGPVALAERMAAVDVPGYTSVIRAGFSAGVGFVLALLGIGLGYPGQPHVVNRFMALRDDTALGRGRIIAIIWAVVVYAGMLLLGWCGRVLFALGDQEVVFIIATKELFPPVVAGVMLAAVLSAIMSTADSQLLVAASSVTHDLGLGGDSTVEMVRRSRWVVLLLSLAAAVAAMVGSQEIFRRVLFAWTAMGAAFGPLLLVVILRGPVAPRWAVAAMASGFGLAVAAYLTPGAAGTVSERVLPFLVALLLAVIGQRRAV